MSRHDTVRMIAETLSEIQTMIDPDEYDPEDEDDQPGVDVRLQVHEGSITVRWGDAQYDHDHRGVWGASWLSHDADEDDLEELAEDLLDDAEGITEPEDEGEWPAGWFTKKGRE